MISVVILTKNEVKNIQKCLLSLVWCDEIIIVDDYSQDRTLNLIKNFELRIKNFSEKVKVYRKHLEGDFSGSRNFGLTKAHGDWILFVDADEMVTEDLKNEIKIALASNYSGYYLQRKDYFLGKWLEYGETGKVKLLRLAKKNTGLWQGKVHETWEIKGQIGKLKNPLRHYPHPTIEEFLNEVNFYTDLVVQYWKGRRKKMSFWEIIFYPWCKFFYNYLLRGGFLDGVAGLILALMMSFHSFLVRAKFWLSMHKEI